MTTTAMTPIPATAPPEDRPPTRRARRFARLWPMLDDSVDELLRPAKEVLFADLPDSLVEIGTGRGANFRYLRPGTAVMGFEPNVLFHDAAREAAAAGDVDLDLRAQDLRDAALPAGSVEVVVSTLVLCSVPEPADALGEIRRVLAPGGRLVFIEHVGARGAAGASRYQRLLRRPWAAVADGCDTCAASDRLIERAGFQVGDLRRERLGSRLDPTSATVWGVATKPA